ncbi:MULTISPECIES: HlyD family secretion protein [Acidiphilium]|uniref:HlyD family secretion protein n=1 Tax=Acidiphilium TaxID=522 RepID=UPI00257D1911|nr:MULTISPECIES: HlyD family secretion protein [Acidiphilium]HQT85847.1 HlyD family secretion protein [Acidiphilium rubrum]
MRAPEAGTVSAIVVDPGQPVQAGRSVISVMPAGSVLRAQLLVPSRAIGFIHPDSRLNLHYAAFPYQEFGQYHGVVASISRSALTPAQVSGLIQEQTKRSLYRVMVRLDRQLVDVYGRPEHLKAGLGLKASIMLDRRPATRPSVVRVTT